MRNTNEANNLKTLGVLDDTMSSIIPTKSSTEKLMETVGEYFETKKRP